MGKVTAKAIVRVDLEVEIEGSWGGECPVEQIHEQAARQALDYLQQNPVLNNRVRSAGIHGVKCVSSEVKR
jgi:hypothetical protein